MSFVVHYKVALISSIVSPLEKIIADDLYLPGLASMLQLLLQCFIQTIIVMYIYIYIHCLSMPEDT